MRTIEEKGCPNNGTTQETSGKPTPSKWDDAQKWLVNLSRGEKNQAKASPRNSNADDRRLIAPVAKKDYSSGEEEGENVGCPGSNGTDQYEMETKNVDCDDSVWRISKPVNSSKSVVRSICVRDMGTEMTPIASQEPSRTATPIRATTPAARSPMSSGSSTPVRCANGVMALGNSQNTAIPSETRGDGGRASSAIRQFSRDGEESNNGGKTAENKTGDPSSKLNPLETRAVAWDEAERAKYMARYKREEVKIQAWENHQKRKAEMEMRKTEVKAERLKSRAQEKYTNKLAATRRIAEEKRANAEAKLNEKAVKTSERADYIRRTGHLPSSFSFKLPSFCWKGDLEYERGRSQGQGRDSLDYRSRVRQKDVREREAVNGGHRSTSSRSHSGSSGGAPRRCGFVVRPMDREPGELSSDGSDGAMDSESQVNKEAEVKMLENGGESSPVQNKKRKFSPIIWDRDDREVSRTVKSRNALESSNLPPPPPLIKTYPELPNSNSIPDANIPTAQDDDSEVHISEASPSKIDLLPGLSEVPVETSSLLPQEEQPWGDNQGTRVIDDDDYLPARTIISSRWATDADSPADEGEISDYEDKPKLKRKSGSESAEPREVGNQ
ncbi:UNVERIFIED_CONTAM: Cyclin-dependent kinase G-2 [Sesamum latifolium]|uniref:Cyclin-dependent kinase G-2 n=1 Tax=Sesamum latifolium TaxID=2727402 RepID=A0AAW2UYJ4_9LAMI